MLFRSGFPSNSYFVQLINNDTSAQLWKSVNGVTTSLVDRPGVAAVTTAKQWVRMQVRGTSIKVKVWTDGTAEATNWEVTATDSSVTAPGVPQLKWLWSSPSTAAREVYIDDITITSP